MSYTDIPLSVTISPLLKSREQIRAEVDLLVRGIGFFHFLVFLPFLRIKDETQNIAAQLQGDAESTANQWGLQFKTAEDALDRSAYRSLADELMTITSPEFVMKKVVVRQIVPITERIPVVPPPRPEPRKLSRAERSIASLDESVEAFDAVERFREEKQTTHPHLFKPVVGFNGMPTRSPLDQKIESVIGQILESGGE
jgi:hypothetical protein